MNIFLDIETCPCADKQPFIDAARADFKAPSTLTKEKAGADLGLVGDDLKFKNKDTVIEMWTKRFAEEKAPEVADEEWRKTALNGTSGRILSIAWKSEAGKGIHCQDPANEAENLSAFFESLESHLSVEARGRPAYFIGHNVTFDLKFLYRRAVILGVIPPFDLPFRGRHDKDYFCTMQGWCEHGERISLANLCAALGIESKNDMDGSKVCDAWLAGEYDRIAEYNADDVRLTEHVYRRLTFAAA